MRLTKAVVLDWLRRRRACEGSTTGFIRRTGSMRRAWERAARDDATWVLDTLGLLPDGWCLCLCCSDLTAAEINRQWPFELIEALILDQMAAPPLAEGGQP